MALNNKQLLAWFLFMRMDTVSTGDLTPLTFERFLEEYFILGKDKVKELILEEFREEDLPLEIR